MPLENSVKPFLFKTQLSLVLLTGFKAADIKELRDGLKKVPESSIYYHTHHFLQQHQFLVEEPPNDFAYWVTHVLNESRIGEKLTAIDTVRFSSLEELRDAIISAIDPFVEDGTVLRKTHPEQTFHFMRSVLFNLKTSYEARNLEEFVRGLKNVSIQSLYFHMFEARLRTSRRVNDFSFWLQSLDETALAKEIERLDPYSQTMEDVRFRIIRMIEKRLGRVSYVAA